MPRAGGSSFELAQVNASYEGGPLSGGEVEDWPSWVLGVPHEHLIVSEGNLHTVALSRAQRTLVPFMRPGHRPHDLLVALLGSRLIPPEIGA